jgi:SAM-dependent methyltransferase
MTLQPASILTRLRDAYAFRGYERHLTRCLRANPGNRPLAFAQAVGSDTMAAFREQGDGHVAVLRSHGLHDGMTVFDLGCGCGRTAQALRRAGWQGQYIGVDVVERFVAELRARCPGYQAFRHRQASIPADDDSLDMLFHWSVFTHLSLEDCFLYLKDTYRALKPGGKTVFSFLELTEASHRPVFASRVRRRAAGRPLALVDTFLHRDWISLWAGDIGFAPPQFTDGGDARTHPAFWQSLVALRKPA